MGLLNKFLQDGSEYGAGQGGNSADLQSERDAIIGALKQSPLHAQYGFPALPGYSLNGSPYLPNLPNPAALDLNGQTPTVAGHGGNTSLTQNLPYINNEPG